MASTEATFACLTNVNVRLPVPQPTSRTRSPATRPAKSINSGASLRLQRPIKESYLSAPREMNFELMMAKNRSLYSSVSIGSAPWKQLLICQCLSWVKSRHELVRVMSALPPKADMDQRGRDLRFVPFWD